MATIDPNDFLQNVQSVYSDLDVGLRQNADGTPIILRDEDSIVQSIKAILSTYPGERIMQPLFGSRVKEYLFGQLDIGTLDLIEAEIETAIARWEPRVRVGRIDIEIDPDRNIIRFYVSYTVIRSGRNLVFTGSVNLP
jgi:phage baseplate assembly protein W